MHASRALELLQWPAMVVTVTASWFVTSRYKSSRWVGFCLFLASNVMWAVWGVFSHAVALVVLQACLALMNVIGLKRSNAAPSQDKEASPT